MSRNFIRLTELPRDIFQDMSIDLTQLKAQASRATGEESASDRMSDEWRK
jgi:hypothetical protein